MDEKQKTGIFLTEWLGFNSNIGALYTFFENLSETADKLDKEKKRKVAAKIAPILHEDPEVVEREFFEFMPSIDDLDIYPDIREDASLKEAVKLFQDVESINKFREWENKHPHKSYKLARNLLSLYSNPPISGLILRKSMLITLVTFLEVLIETLFTNHFLIHGLSKEEATEQAERSMKGGWNKRLDNLSLIGIPISVLSTYRREILDITNLRNLLVHSDGVVDQEYLKHPIQNYHGELKAGRILIVSTRRLGQALNTIWIYGLLLCQAHWRYHENSEKAQNDKLDQFFLYAFDEERYGLILDWSEKTELLNLTESTNQRILVDRAIAFRELNKPDEVKKIVSMLRSIPHDWQIDIALSMLDKDYKTLMRQLTDAKSKYDIRRSSHWPLFEPIKNELWFKTAFIQNRRKIFTSKRQKK